jgi:hypothetical protein
VITLVKQQTDKINRMITKAECAIYGKKTSFPSSIAQSISIKVLVREKKSATEKKKEPQKLFLTKLNTKPL